MRSRARVYAHSYNTVLSLLEKELAVGELLPFQADLAERCQVSQATISRLLGDLQKVGLVTAGGDGRRLLRKPTESDLLPQPRGLSLRDEVEQDILEMLTSGELRPGSTVAELGLAKKFGVTTETVREALHKLSRLGIFTKPARRQWQFAKLGMDQLNHLFDLRDLLEIHALKRYFQTPERKPDTFLAILEKMRNLQKSEHLYRSDITRSDWELHRAILASSGNPYLAEYFQFAVFATQIQGHHYSDAIPDVQRRSIIAVSVHIRILEAIVADQEALALQLLTEHLQTARGDFEYFLRMPVS